MPVLPLSIQPVTPEARNVVLNSGSSRREIGFSKAGLSYRAIKSASSSAVIHPSPFVSI